MRDYQTPGALILFVQIQIITFLQSFKSTCVPFHFTRPTLKEVCNSSSECRSFSFYCTLTNGKLIKVYSEITDVKRSFAKMIKAFQIVFHIFILSCPHFCSGAK